MIVKHTGFEVTPDSELNGITFNAVGSGTVVENVQAYSTYDDGFEFFGGAVNVTNAIALYVRDDSLDYSDGYVGTITNALVIHYQTDGNRCIEGDNVGSARSDVGVPLDTAPLTDADDPQHDLHHRQHGRQHARRLRGRARAPGRPPAAREHRSCTAATAPRSTRPPATSASRSRATESLAAAAAWRRRPSWRATTSSPARKPIKGALANGDALTEWFLGANPSTNGADYSFNAGNFVIADAANANTQVLAARHRSTRRRRSWMRPA